MLYAESFARCFPLTRTIHAALHKKQHEFYERVSQWTNPGSEYFSHKLEVVAVPRALVDLAVNATTRVVEELETEDYEQFIANYQRFFPRTIRSLAGLCSDAPPSYMLDWALIENDGSYSLSLVELNGCTQESLSGIHWLRTALETAGLADNDFLQPCSNDESGYVEALRSACRDRTVLWLSYVGQECNLLNRIFGLPIVNPWDLRIAGEALVDRDHRPIKRILSTVFYPFSLQKLHGRSLPCLKGSVLDTLPAEGLGRLNVDWWPTFHGMYHVSKLSLPYLSNRLPQLVPESHFLSEFQGDCAKFVIKPLFDHAARGVIVHPTADDLAFSHPQAVIMKRIAYVPAMLVPGTDGPDPRAVEIRCLAVRNSTGALKVSCPTLRLMRQGVLFSNPDCNKYPYGGVVHALSVNL